MGLKSQFNRGTRGEKAMMERTLEILLLSLLSIYAGYGQEEEDGGCFGDKLEPKEAFLSSTYKSPHGIEFEAELCFEFDTMRRFVSAGQEGLFRFKLISKAATVFLLLTISGNDGKDFG